MQSDYFGQKSLQHYSEMTDPNVFTYKSELNLPTKYMQQCFENSMNQDRKNCSELLTWVVLLDPADAVLINLFGFLGQHSVL